MFGGRDDLVAGKHDLEWLADGIPVETRGIIARLVELVGPER